jgi:hypothetical protein
MVEVHSIGWSGFKKRVRRFSSATIANEACAAKIEAKMGASVAIHKRV